VEGHSLPALWWITVPRIFCRAPGQLLEWVISTSIRRRGAGRM
jgi:hypothetical protein